MTPDPPEISGVYVLCRCRRRTCQAEAWVAGMSVPAGELPVCPRCSDSMLARHPLCFLHVFTEDTWHLSSREALPGQGEGLRGR